jgi:hypothetical protein
MTVCKYLCVYICVCSVCVYVFVKFWKKNKRLKKIKENQKIKIKK